MNRRTFLDAASRGDDESVSAGLREDRALARAVDERGRTALHLCARTPAETEGRDGAGALRVARALLAAGADVNAIHDIPDEDGSFKATPLWYAVAWSRNPALVKLLLRAGASPRGCLWACVFNDDLETATTLVLAGAPLDEVEGGESPLDYARRMKKAAFFKLLGGR